MSNFAFNVNLRGPYSTELRGVTEERDSTRGQYDELRKRRLDEFMAGRGGYRCKHSRHTCTHTQHGISPYRRCVFLSYYQITTKYLCT